MCIATYAKDKEQVLNLLTEQRSIFYRHSKVLYISLLFPEHLKKFPGYSQSSDTTFNFPEFMFPLNFLPIGTQ
jgi:hypothetical protein